MYLKAFGQAFSQIDDKNYVWDTSNLLFIPIED